MSRSRLLLVAASLAAGAVGCAHCDTCDDFPTPCLGPNCGYNAPARAMVAPAYPVGTVVGPATTVLTPAPAPTSPAPTMSAPVTSAPATPAPARPASPATPRERVAPGETTSPPEATLPELPR